jgi:hypothetical protein
MHFNIQKLLNDLGGASTVAKQISIGRTVPYGWVRRSFIGSHHLSKIKEANPELDINDYFELEDNHGATNTGSST